MTSPFVFVKTTTLGARLCLDPQVCEVLESRRGSPQGFKDEFVDKAVEGMNHWMSAARRGLMCWGFLVLQKAVSMPNHQYILRPGMVFLKG